MFPLAFIDLLQVYFIVYSNEQADIFNIKKNSNSLRCFINVLEGRTMLATLLCICKTWCGGSVNDHGLS